MTLNDKRVPRISIFLLALVCLGAIFAGLLAPFTPSQMDTQAILDGPSTSHIFGTDTLGRDLFSMIWYGARQSLFIGALAAAISTVIALVYGTVAGLAGERTSDVLMRLTEILMSIPQILLLIFLQAMWGQASAISLAVVIGVTGWMNMSKIVRSEVRQIEGSDFVLAARTFGAGFFYILRKHLFPNLYPAIMFMIVSAVSSAIAMEATLSFLGLGLPLEVVSWGSLMQMSESVLLSGNWHLILIPGIFLVTTIVCITDIGEYVRRENNRLYSNL